MTVNVEALLSESAIDTTHLTCQTCRWLDSRPDDERQKWIEALSQPKTWPGAQIARAMAMVEQPEGAPVAPTDNSVQNHQRNKHIKGAR